MTKWLLLDVGCERGRPDGELFPRWANGTCAFETVSNASQSVGGAAAELLTHAPAPYALYIYMYPRRVTRRSHAKDMGWAAGAGVVREADMVAMKRGGGKVHGNAWASAGAVRGRAHVRQA